MSKDFQQPLLKIENLSKDYSLGKIVVHALRGVNLEVPQGDLLVISGPSGSGKTTLLNLIGAIARPTSGDVFLEGRALSKLSDGRLAELRNHKIGFIFQSFALIPVLSVYENVEYPLLLLGTSRKERQRRVMDVLGEVGLGELARRRPNDLSGGQHQRVAIARALVTEPRLVLADEPSANLDSETGDEIMKLMARLNKEQKVTFIVVTHDPVVSRYARRSVHIRDGRLLNEGVETRACD
ncbi:ABC transporter ATP-binding protein [Dehalococcoidia bacterium]|nr:ABC transporter ATP-binding protein [Dehalococcoidia bacterium]